MKSIQAIVLCLLIAATSASSVARHSKQPSGLEEEVQPLLRIRRQSTNGTGGLCVPNGGYCAQQHHCCSGVCQTFNYKCAPRHSEGAQIDLVSTIIEATSGFGGGLENRFGENETAPVCAKDGEYCQMSQQCCSRRCLSYSYKCVPDHSVQPVDGGIQSNRPIATIPQHVMTIDELINNRFGESSSTTNTCLSNGVSCTDSNKCCSRFCAQATLNSRICAQRGNDVRPQVPQQPSSSALLPQVPQTPPPFLYPTGPDPDTSDECEPIGHKCYVHEECCSRRCHGFLHQCVT